MSALLTQDDFFSTAAQRHAVQSEVAAGLSSPRKRLSSKFFYDARGSELFELICEQPEYYLTKTELGIMQASMPKISRAIGERARLVEFGSGSGIKTRMLLRGLVQPAAYIPIEISESALEESVQKIRRDHPELEVTPVAGDFTRRVAMPQAPDHTRRTVVYIPGSTIGNFEHHDALSILTNIREIVGIGGGALIGFDLQKGRSDIEAAYNDRAGVTAAFTLNMLTHLNREAGTNFDESGFCHHAYYDEEAGRIETNLVSLRDQAVRLGHRSYTFAEGERMLVEYSHKYTIEQFGAMARQADMVLTDYWTDPMRRFAVVHLVSALRGLR